MLVACGSGPPPSDADFPGQRFSAADGARIASEPPPSAAPAVTAPPVQPVETPAETPPQTAARPAIDDDPKRLLGLDPEGIQAILGTPSFLRRDNPAQLWRYRNKSCILDIFLYADQSAHSHSFRVRHVEARSANADRASARECLRTLLAERGQTPTG